MGSKDDETLLRQYETIIDNIQTNIFLIKVTKDGSLRLEKMNRSLEVVTGLSSESMKENIPVDIFGKKIGERIVKKCEQCLTENKTITYEESSMFQNEGGIWQINLKPIKRDGELIRIVGDLTEITERKRAQEDILHWKDLMSYVIQHDPNAIAVFDKDLHFIFASERFLNDYQVKEKDIIGKHHYDVFPDIPEKWRNVHQRALQGEIIRAEEDFFIRKDGSTDYTSWECRPWYQSDDSIGGIILYTEVITKQKETEHELIRAKELAETSNRAKSEFLATMSHELRTPLNGVIGFGEILRKTGLNEIQTEYLNTILISAEKLLDIISDILNLTELEADKAEITPVKTSLEKTIGKTLEYFDLQAAEKDITLSMNLSEDCPEYIKIDPARLKQIFLNLLSNAVKFTDKGRIEVKIEALNIDEEKGEADLLFSVSDTGIGIKESDQGYILNAFTQLDMSTTRSYGGTGLGLTIVNRLLKKMGSELKIHSVYGEGSCFSFELSVPYEDAKCPSFKKAKGDSRVQKRTFKNKKILIAEDDDINMNFVKTVFKLLSPDMHILEAINGREAYDLYREHHPDLIFMDIVMPDMDGYQATALIRQENKEVPIVALTAKVLKDDKAKCLDYGMNDYLSKPVSIHQLRSTLQRYLDNTRNNRTYYDS